MDADRRPVRRKLKAVVNIFAPVVRSNHHALSADQVVADLVESDGRGLAIVAVEFVVVRIISIGIFREHETSSCARREIAAVLLENHYVENASERGACVS